MPKKAPKKTAKKTARVTKRATSAKPKKTATRAKAAAPAAPAKAAPGPTKPAHPHAGTVAMVRDLAAIVERRLLTELIIDLPDATVTLRRGPAEGSAMSHTTAVLTSPLLTAAPQLAVPAAAPAEAPAAVPAAEPEPVEDDRHVVTSPFVGTFYRSPNPDAEQYVEVGTRVSKGDVLCIVEAMKLMNEIEADASGVIAEILVENAQPVEYGQSLFKISR